MALILLGIIAVIAVLIYAIYNGLVTAKVRVDQSWKDIDIQLKKRYDLLPDLIETAKRATALDEKILTEVTRLRSEGMKVASGDSTPAKRSQIEGQISTMMRDIKVQVEAYPDIKSHGELQSLMNSVSDIEDKIAYARQFYNANTGEYNTKVRVFPAVLISGMFGFKPAEYFEAPAEERKDVKVDFSEMGNKG